MSVLTRLAVFAGRHWFKLRGIAVPRRWQLNGWPIIERHQGSSISLGERVVLTSKSRFTALGVAHPVVIRTLAPGAAVRIGADTGLSGTTICAQTSVAIGCECLIGADVVIVDTDFHPLKAERRRFRPLTDAASQPVTIGNNVFIGSRTLILKGVSIGENSVIGAGSVVVFDIPSNCVAAGNPCKVLRELES